MSDVTWLSVIIPVYNVAEYLGRCLDSLLRQRSELVEFVIVDDGSTDGSGELCDEYAIRDNRFRVIHKANAGVSAARNTGLEAARGEYIAFVDGDDYLADNYCDCLERHLKPEVDMLYFGRGYVEDGRIVNSGNCQTADNGQATIREICRRGLFSGFVWTYVYRRNIIEKAGLCFSTDMKYAEDWEFILKYYANASCFYVSSQCLYYQVRREGSATNRRLGRKYIEDNFTMFERVLCYTEKKDRCFRQFLYRQFYAITAWFFNNVMQGNGEARGTFVRCYKNSALRHPIFYLSPVMLAAYIGNSELFGIAWRVTKRLS